MRQPGGAEQGGGYVSPAKKLPISTDKDIFYIFLLLLFYIFCLFLHCRLLEKKAGNLNTDKEAQYASRRL